MTVSNPQISPDGKLAAVVGHRGRADQLYLYPLDETPAGGGGRGGRGGAEAERGARQLTTTPGAKNHAQFSPDSKEVYYLEGGRVQAITSRYPQWRAP